MTRPFLLLLSALAIAFGTCPLTAAEGDAAVEARREALELAGAFSNDGFKIRDGHWCGTVPEQGRAVVAVNLYAGNEYWFSVGAEQPAEFGVEIFDETGRPVTKERYHAERQAAAGFSPEISGQYFVAINGTGGIGHTYCLVYSYK